MFKLLVVIASVLCIVAGDSPYHSPAPYHPAPYHPAPYHETAKPYAFEYGVHDEYTGTNFNAQETTDGKTVHGSYNVQLPDGRLQTVTYTADDYNGFVADVKYEGKPHYDEYKPAPYKPAPYKPAPPVYHKPAPPVYHKPAPVYHKPAPIYHKPAPYRPAPVYHKPAPIYHKPAPYHPAPIYKPAPYHPSPIYKPYHG